MFMKHRTGLMMVAAVLLAMMLVVAGCSAPSTGDTGDAKGHYPTIKAIKERGELVVGTGSGYFPFEMVDKNGDVIGFDMDVAQKIADVLDVELVIQDMDFTALIPSLQANKIDIVLAGMTITPKRALTVNFTRPYFVTGQGMIVNKKWEGQVSSWEDLDKEGMVIALAMGTTGDLLAQSIFKHAELKQFDGSSTAGLEVISGRADAIVYDIPWCAIYAKMNSDNVFTLHLTDPISEEKFGIAVAPGEEDLLQWLDTFLWSWVDTLDYMEMIDYWFVAMPWWDDVEH